MPAPRFRHAWDVAEDRRFLMISLPPSPLDGDLVLVQNWFSEVRELLGLPQR